MAVPSTPTRKALMPPPPLPTPTTPSNALVLRKSPGPITPITPTTPKKHSVVVQVKSEAGVSSAPSRPRRICPPPTPPSTSLIRRTRAITPSPRRRSSISIPRTRTPIASSSAAFIAKLAKVRALSRTPRGRNATPGPSLERNGNGNAASTDDAVDEEVQFWRSGQRRGSTADVAIAVDSDDEEDATPGSPTPTSAGSEASHPTGPNRFQAPGIQPRDHRAASSFSMASFNSRDTPFLRDPTWDDSDQRYGRTYPKVDGASRDPNSAALAPLNNVTPIPLVFAQNITKFAELLKGLNAKPLDKIKLADQIQVTDLEKMDILQSVFFKNEMDESHRNMISQIKHDLDASNVSVSNESISTLVKSLKLSLHQTLKSYFKEYKDPAANYKGTKEMRQNMWYNEFKTYLKFSTSVYSHEGLNKDMAENILFSFRVFMGDKDQMVKIVEILNEKFDNVNLVQIRKLLDALIDICAQIINISWLKQSFGRG